MAGGRAKNFRLCRLHVMINMSSHGQMTYPSEDVVHLRLWNAYIDKVRKANSLTRLY